MGAWRRRCMSKVSLQPLHSVARRQANGRLFPCKALPWFASISVGSGLARACPGRRCTCCLRGHHVSESFLVLIRTCFPQFNVVLLAFAVSSIQKGLNSCIPHHLGLSLLPAPTIWRKRLRNITTVCLINTWALCCGYVAFCRHVPVFCFRLHSGSYGLLALPTHEAAACHRTFAVLCDLFRAKNAMSSS